MKLSRTVLVLGLAALLVASADAQSRGGGKGGGGGKPPPKDKDKGGPTFVVPKPPEFTTGYVKSYDVASHQLMLNNGGVFRLAPMIADTPHPAGEKVKLRWTLQGSHRYADQVEVTMAAPAAAAATSTQASAPADAPAPAVAAPPAASGSPTG